MNLKASTRLLLVLLQLAIGWHFFYEGVWKFQNPSWSSKGYLKNAAGPAALPLRSLAGDPDVVPFTGSPAATDIGQRFDAGVWRLKETDPTPDLVKRLTPLDPETKEPVAPGQAKEPLRKYMPEPVEKEWDAYFAAFVKQFKLNPEGLAQKQDIVLMTNLALVGASGDTPGGFAGDAALRSLVLSEHEKRPDASIQLIQAEATLELLKDAYVEWLLEGKKKVKRPNFAGPASEVEVPIWQRLQEYLAKLDEVAALEAQEAGTFHVSGPSKAAKARSEAAAIKSELEAELDNRTTLMKKALRDVLTYEQKRMADVPEPVVESKGWQQLATMDATVKWGLLVIGGCLLLGLFTRSACVLGAALLALFYVSLPPLPGVPEGPMTEGHYLLVNKNLIELLALLALATTRPGDRYGLDVWIGSALRKLRPATKKTLAAAPPPAPPPPTPIHPEPPNGDAATHPAPAHTPELRS
jgi:uncharacterized membrane protein YphA (DoxX/SURF4 family)